MTLNCSGDPCTGANAGTNFGSVTFAQKPDGTITVTVQLAQGYVFATGSSSYAVLWNIAGNPDLDVTIRGSNSDNFSLKGHGWSDNAYAASPFSKSANSCSGGDADGCFDYAISHTSGTDSRLVFDVSADCGLLLSDFTTTSRGYTFAVDIVSLGTGKTSYVAVPEPQSWTMALAGLIGLAGLVMFRRRRGGSLTCPETKA